jgi:hypothetical protein
MVFSPTYTTFEVDRRFRCTMRVDCGQLDPGAVIRPDPGERRSGCGTQSFSILCR